MAEVLATRSGPDDRVAEIVLNRPRRRNALTVDAIDALRAALERVATEPGVGAVLLSGAGGCFCSGLDLAELGATPDGARRRTTAWGEVHRLLAGLDVPVVAALERAAVNAGAALALAADLLVVGEAAFLQVQEVVRDMVPSANVAWLAFRYGPARALDLVLTGRRLDGPELYRLGMAHDCVPDAEVLDRARALAATLAGNPTRAVTATKALVRDVAGLGVRSALDVAFAPDAARDEERGGVAGRS